MNKRLLSSTWTKVPVASITWQRDKLCPKRAVCCYNFKETLEMKSSVVQFFFLSRSGHSHHVLIQEYLASMRRSRSAIERKGRHRQRKIWGGSKQACSRRDFPWQLLPLLFFLNTHTHTVAHHPLFTPAPAPKKLKSETGEILPGFKISLSSSPTSGYSQRRDLPKQCVNGFTSGEGMVITTEL